MNCSKCGKALPVDHLEFCPFCGVRIKSPSPKYPVDKSPNNVNEEGKQIDICPYCGEEILLRAIKCIHCNELLDKKYDESKKKVFEVDTILNSQIILMQSPIVLSVLVLLAIIVGVVSLLSGVPYGTAIALGVLSSLVFLLLSLKLISDKSKDEMNENEIRSHKIGIVIVGVFIVFLIVLLSAGLSFVGYYKDTMEQERQAMIRQCQMHVIYKYQNKLDHPFFQPEFDTCVEKYGNE